MLGRSARERHPTAAHKATTAEFPRTKSAGGRHPADRTDKARMTRSNRAYRHYPKLPYHSRGSPQQAKKAIAKGNAAERDKKNSECKIHNSQLMDSLRKFDSTVVILRSRATKNPYSCLFHGSRLSGVRAAALARRRPANIRLAPGVPHSCVRIPDRLTLSF